MNADKVCDQQPLPDTVYFAGRGRELKTFIEAVAADGRKCPIKVITGDDAVGLFYDLQEKENSEEYRKFVTSWRSSGVEVQYTALAHPDEASDLYGESEEIPSRASTRRTPTNSAVGRGC
ncbi:hypothetical protein NKH77_37790 [Streptomyces sp. M19]